MTDHPEDASGAPAPIPNLVFVLLWFGGVLLPVLALAGAALVCMVSYSVSALPVLVHAMLIATVPLANAQLLTVINSEQALPSARLALLHSLATGVSMVYAVLLLPLVPSGIVLIILFGAGLLLLAPLLSLIAALGARRLLRRLRPRAAEALGSVWPGVLLAVAIIGALELPMAVTRIGMSMAESKAPATSASGLRLLRHLGNDNMLLGLCYQMPPFGTDMIGMFEPAGYVPSQEKSRSLYFRIHGIVYNALPVPASVDRERTVRQEDAASSSVGARPAGLHLVSSRIDATLDARAALGSLDWTMTFRNDGANAQDVRVLANLPAGAVVARVTLSDGGDEQTSLIGGALLRQRQLGKNPPPPAGRAAAIVSTVGQDRIMLHLRQVPAKGERTVRIALAAPLVLNELRLGYLQLPSFSDSNVDIAVHLRHTVSVQSDGALRAAPGMLEETGATLPFALRGELAEPLPGVGAATIGVLRDPQDTHAWSPDPGTPGGAIVQIIGQQPARIPRRVALVIDASVALGAQREQLARAATSFPGNVELGVIVAGGEAPQVFLHDASDSLSSVRYLQDIAFEGGRDNSAALLTAWEWAAASSDGAVVWIHGPQPLMPASADALLQHVRQRPGQVRMFDLEALTGPNLLWEQLDGIGGLSRVPRIGSLHDDLARLLTGWKPAAQQVVVTRSRTSAPQPAQEQASQHLMRLWASERAAALRAQHDQATPPEADELLRLERMLADSAEGAPAAPLAPIAPPSAAQAQAIPAAVPASAIRALDDARAWLMLAVALGVVGWRIRFHLRTPYPACPRTAKDA